MLYGMYPDSEPVENGPLKPVMTLKARVSQVRNLPKGATVSDGVHIAPRKASQVPVFLPGMRMAIRAGFRTWERFS